MDEKLGLSILIVCLCLLLIAYEHSKLKKKYNALKENHERLKNDMKLIQQENYYLKMLRDADQRL